MGLRVLIKIVTTETDFNFDVGSLGVVATSQQKGEIWVYVPGGVQRITITHSQLGVLRNYYFPIPVEKARTYELILVSGTVRTIVEQVQTSQFVVFKIQPISAVIFIDEDDAPHPLDSEGMYSVRLNKGRHTYRVTAASYMPESGAIDVGSEKITKQINLKSALAELTVKTEADAEIWINEEQVGMGSWTGSVEAGIYLVEARKPSHISSKQEVSLIKQERQTITLAPPVPMYGSLEVTGTPIEADVYIDGTLMGQIPLFIDKLLIGNHSLEITKNGYAARKDDIVISDGETINLNVALNQAESSGFHNSHEYVDLGLSVKWATCNVGAENPEEYGDYYAWGETERKKDYSLSSYIWYDNSSNTLTKYKLSGRNWTDDINKTILESEDDVAHIKWGGNWRMPTTKEIKELRRKCTWTWTTINNVNGYRITSNKKGYTDRSIFLPAAGYYNNVEVNRIGTSGFYWSRVLNTRNSSTAVGAFFNDCGSRIDREKRNNGRSVRAVCPK